MIKSGWSLFACALIAVVAAQRDRFGSENRDEESSFVITSINRGRGNSGSGNSDRGSSSNFDRDRVGSSGDRFAPSDRLTSGGDRGSSSGRTRFPDFARIEVEIQRLENPGGILANGKKCDVSNACDPRITAFIDTNKPLSPWPGSVPAKKWPIIFEVSNSNSPTIGKSLNVDVCGGSVNKVNARVQIVDGDALTGNDDINNFECLFDVDPRDISLDANSAQWGRSIQCKGASQPDKIRLFARQRAYQIPSTSCRATSSG